MPAAAGTAVTAVTTAAVPAVTIVIVGEVTDVLAGLTCCHLGSGGEGRDSAEDCQRSQQGDDFLFHDEIPPMVVSLFISLASNIMT